MKLRIKGDSLRLRISPSEVERLLATGRVEDTIHFGPEQDARLTYVLEHAPQPQELEIRYRPSEVSVVLSSDRVRSWAHGPEEGIYAEVPAGQGTLQVSVEKDFACLDRSDAENEDTFPHPQQGAQC